MPPGQVFTYRFSFLKSYEYSDYILGSFIFFLNLFFIFLSLHYFFIVFQEKLSLIYPPIFSPVTPTQTFHSQSYPTLFCQWVLYTCYLTTLSLLSPVPLPLLPSGYCLFFISKSVVIFCLLVCFVD